MEGVGGRGRDAKLGIRVIEKRELGREGMGVKRWRRVQRRV